MKCEHITKCNKCDMEVCSYCVEDCSGCQLEWCKDCYLEHQVCCSECLTMICPKEEVLVEVQDDGFVTVCPKCNMWNVE